MQQIKHCTLCGKSYSKSANCSKKNWEKSKFCSHQCQIISLKGQVAWNKGVPRTWKVPTQFKKGFSWSKEVKNKMKKRIPWNKGVPMSEETKQKLREKRALQTNIARGKRHGNWQGGITKLTLKIRHLLEYKIWRKTVYERDNYKCVSCQRGGKLIADHIKPFCVLLLEGNIKTISQAKKFKPLWNINNGQTLCRECHSKTKTYGLNARYLMKKLRS